jgi:hypothetical protein
VNRNTIDAITNKQLSVAVASSSSSSFKQKIYPITTWYDITCRYPCQNLMNFWHVIFGEEITVYL